MSLFVAVWLDQPSWLIDAKDVAHAATIAADVGESGYPPSAILPLAPGVFVAEFGWAPDEEEADAPTVDEVFYIDPLEHAIDVLEALDDTDLSKLAKAPTEPAPSAGLVTTHACGAEAEVDDGVVVVCTLPPHEGPNHEAVDGDGRLVRWSDHA